MDFKNVTFISSEQPESARLVPNASSFPISNLSEPVLCNYMLNFWRNDTLPKEPLPPMQLWMFPVFPISDQSELTSVIPAMVQFVTLAKNAGPSAVAASYLPPTFIQYADISLKGITQVRHRYL